MIRKTVIPRFPRFFYVQLKNPSKIHNRSILLYTGSIFVGILGISYASVPLYRVICRKMGWAGTPVIDASKFTPEKMVPLKNAERIRVTFNADVSDLLNWKFIPQQKEIYVLPGETALGTSFLMIKSLDQDIIGISTYNVTPPQAAPYFSKIACFCFEEQKLNAGESVDMPVLFFIDPDFVNDPLVRDIRTITLSYTFFKSSYENVDDLGSA
ncbi:hypothetical protein PCANB_002185 [Pneumocystis canis]|nr:hypothetical protein PCANB_002185 [Pneumocystis canis]